MVLATDPVVTDHIGAWSVGIVLVKVLLGFVFCLIATLFMVWFERKVIAGMQNRIGPNKAGRWGILQTLADGIKAFFKEDLLPDRADRFVFRLAPFLAVVPAFVTFAVIPIAGDFSADAPHPGQISVWGHLTTIQVADPPIGILLVLAMSSIAVYGVMLAGWSSGSKYPLLGAVRASAQMVSYEAALGLAVATVVMVVGSLSTLEIVRAQDTLVRWNLVATGFIPFVIFVVASTAELNRPPFDLVEAEQELVGGYQTEYAGIRFALFYLAEFMGTVLMSAIIVTLFLGGPTAPFAFLDRIPDNIHDLGGPDVIHGLWHFLGSPVLWGAIWFFAKLALFLFMYVWFRATLPRFRYDQLMDLGWKVLIPAAFAWFLVLTALRVAQDQGWNRIVVVAIAVPVLLAAFGLLSSALRVSSRRRQLEGPVF
jgi:NADH-quinone oxidoreductase subunit H